MANNEVSSLVEYWLGQISSYEREFKKWEKRANKIIKRYRDEQTAHTQPNRVAKFNILWSNVQTLMPAVYAKLPKPDVGRRFADRDPIGRVASLILERGLEYELQHYHDFRETMKMAVRDRFLGGRGTAWIRYEPHLVPQPTPQPEDGVSITSDADDIDDEVSEQIEYECSPVDYVDPADFGHTVARTWDEVTAAWRRVYMSESALKERFPEKWKKIPLDAEEKDLYKSTDNTNKQKKAEIYEIWDKETEKVFWISKSLTEIIEEIDDPFELEGFFPFPRPLYATITNGSLVPVPDFSLYQDQANELDVISDRIDGLIKALKITGVYDAAQPALQRLFTEGVNNNLIPVNNWLALAEKQGLKGSIDIVDLQPIANALVELYKARQDVLSQIYEITGISDIIRGQTSASETATAQQLKGQYANLRLKSLQEEVAIFATQIIQIKAQIMAKHFQPQTLLTISAADQLNPSDLQLIPQALELIKNEPLKTFRIAIAADSLVNVDEQQEKADRVEYLQAMGGFIAQALPVLQAAPKLAPLVGELIKFGTTAFKAGRPIEGKVDEILDQLEQQASTPPPPPPPDPKLIEVQERAKLNEKVAANEHVFQMEKLNRENAFKAEELNLKREIESQKLLDQKEIEGQRISASQKPTTTLQLDSQGALDQVAQTLQSLHTDQAARMERASENLEKSAEVLAQAASTIAQSVQLASELMVRPRKRDVIRDANGRAVGSLETIQ